MTKVMTVWWRLIRYRRIKWNLFDRIVVFTQVFSYKLEKAVIYSKETYIKNRYYAAYCLDGYG